MMGNIGSYAATAVLAFWLMGSHNPVDSHRREIRHIDSVRSAAVMNVAVLENKLDSLEKFGNVEKGK